VRRSESYLELEKKSFMVQQGIVLGYRVSEKEIEIDKGKINLISSLPVPTSVKCVRSFLGHAGFCRRFIKDFSKAACLLTNLLSKDTPFEFDESCVEAFEKFRSLSMSAPIVRPLNFS